MALTSVEDATARVLAGAARLGTETVAIADAAGRVLAADVIARRAQPPADMSAMDGYAVRGTDVAAAPACLTVIGESAAGRPFPGTVAAGEAVRIFTGAVMPPGTDTVVMQEDTTRDGDRVTIAAPIAAGRNVRTAGGDFAAGQLGLSAGRRLTGRDVMLAAAMDHGSLRVARRPRVAIIQTGDELALPGRSTGAPGEIVVSNVYGLADIARRAGAEVHDLGIAGDRMEAIRALVAKALDGTCDVVVSSGGASVGDHDLMAPALRAEGVDLHLHKIALRPGKPLMFGTKGATRVLGLPGNPVSSHVCALLFLEPLLRALQGEAAPGVRILPARLAVDLPANEARCHYMRAELAYTGDGMMVTPCRSQDSAMLDILSAANCLLIRRPDAPAARAGEPCEIVPFAD